MQVIDSCWWFMVIMVVGCHLVRTILVGESSYVIKACVIMYMLVCVFVFFVKNLNEHIIMFIYVYFDVMKSLVD